MKLIADTKVNAGRQHELDIIRAICVFFMIGTHVIENLMVSIRTPLTNAFLLYVNIYAGATVFMFIMGMSMVYTRHTTVKDFANRGIMLLTLGAVLDFFRSVLPGAVMYIANIEERTIFAYALGVDIMQLAGLGFLLMALLKKMRISPRNIFFISIGLSLLATAIEGCQTGIYGIDQIFGFFWGTYTDSYFPLFVWFIFIAAGQYFGEFYIRLQDKRKWNIIAASVGTVLSVAFIYVSKAVPQGVFRMDSGLVGMAWPWLPDALGCIVVAITEIAIVSLICGGKESRVCKHLSVNVNKYYCISWVVICLIYYAAEFLEVTIPKNDVNFCILLVAICIITTIVVIVYLKFFEKRWEQFFSKHKTFWICTVWVVTIIVAIYGFTGGDEFPNMFNDYL